MSVWVFAAALLAVVLGFEAVMFRYVSDGSADGDSAVPPGDRSESSAAADDATAGGGVRGADGETRRCGSCGADNAAVPTVAFCRECLARID